MSHIKFNLILLHGNDIGAKMEEYRTDAEGNRLGQVGPDLAFFVSSGFASSRQYFSPAFQEQSNFRHLGEDVVNSGETYVVAFARKPEGGKRRRGTKEVFADSRNRVGG